MYKDNHSLLLYHPIIGILTRPNKIICYRCTSQLSVFQNEPKQLFVFPASSNHRLSNKLQDNHLSSKHHPIIGILKNTKTIICLPSIIQSSSSQHAPKQSFVFQASSNHQLSNKHQDNHSSSKHHPIIVFLTCNKTIIYLPCIIQSSAF